MPAGEENDPKGVPFLIAPIRSEDPVKPDKPEPKLPTKEEQAKAELKADSDQLVSGES
jgi:hypothetical protein